MAVSRLAGMAGLGVDRMGAAADAAANPEILRLENLDTDLRPPPAAGSWSMLLDVGALGHRAAEASARLPDRGAVAATPMDNWGEANGPQIVRLVFSNEPVGRLRGLGERVGRALTAP